MFVPSKRIEYTDLKRSVILNSAAVLVGDALVAGTGANSAFVGPATDTSALIVGVCVGIEGLNGKILEKESVTVASDNQTVGKIAAVYIPTNIAMEYEADIDAAAGTTTGSGGIGFFNILASTAGTLDESSWVAFSGTVGHFASYGVTPESTTKVRGYFYKIF